MNDFSLLYGIFIWVSYLNAVEDNLCRALAMVAGPLLLRVCVQCTWRDVARRWRAVWMEGNMRNSGIRGTCEGKRCLRRCVLYWDLGNVPISIVSGTST